MQLLSILLLTITLGVRAAAYVCWLNTNWTGISYEVDFPLRWAGDGTPVNISLLHGPDDNMVFVRNISVNNPNRTLTWNPSEINPSGNYSLVISQGPYTFSSPRFEMIGAISRVPATMSVVVTVTPSVLSTMASEDRIAVTDLPKIVVVGREVVEARATAVAVRQANGTMRMNETASGTSGSVVPTIAVAGAGERGVSRVWLGACVLGMLVAVM